MADFLNFSLQEMDMSAEGVLFREMESRAAPWENLFLEALNKQHADPNTYHLVSIFFRFFLIA